MTKERIVEIAKGIISGDIGVVEGSRFLSGLRFEVANDHDPDFIPFVGIDSESDHIPIGAVREHWSKEGLAKMEKEQKEIEDHYRSWTIEACQKLLERFE